MIPAFFPCAVITCILLNKRVDGTPAAVVTRMLLDGNSEPNRISKYDASESTPFRRNALQKGDNPVTSHFPASFILDTMDWIALELSFRAEESTCARNGMGFVLGLSPIGPGANAQSSGGFISGIDGKEDAA